MIRKKILPILSILLAIALSACSSGVRVTLPSPTAQAPGNSLQESPSQPTRSSEVFFGSLASLQTAYEQIYERVLPSVVAINVSRTVSQPDFQQRGAGSGFIWDTDGHVITNNHVIEGAEIIRVEFYDGTSVLADVIGADAASDLAVLKVDPPSSGLKPIEVMDSTQVRVGQVAIAIGNPFQLSGTMTTGIISGTGRSLPVDSAAASGLYYSIPDIIQTDAAINPGNSGGPLVDIEGRLIGITTAIESPVRANAGIGYVVPSVIVSKVVPILIKEGDYQQPWIGISGTDMVPSLAELMDLEPSQQGALVIEVTAGSPADEAGLVGSSISGEVDGQEVQVGGDVIVSVDGLTINDFEDLVAFLARYALVGQTIELQVLRAGKTIEAPLTLAARPGSERSPQPDVPEGIASQAWLGVQAIDLIPEIAEAMGVDADTSGALIQKVTAKSPADEAGLRGSYKEFELGGEAFLIGGDIITRVDNLEVNGARRLSQLISQYDPEDEVSLSILRDGKTLELMVVLGQRPGN